MNALAIVATAGTALALGLALGLAYFGSLWLVVRRLAPGQRSARLIAASGAVRYAVLALAFGAVVRWNSAALLVALVGLWVARQCLLTRAVAALSPFTAPPARGAGADRTMHGGAAARGGAR